MVVNHSPAVVRSQRVRFANDLSYCFSPIAVTAASNRSKGDTDPGQCLPPPRTYRCTYAKTYTATKWRWHLAVNPAERDTLRRLIRRCGSPEVLKPPGLGQLD